MITIDPDRGRVVVETDAGVTAYPMDTPEAFAAVSAAWLRCGWDTKYVYTFTWLGRPVIQLPEDLIRVQEAIYAVRPDVIVETGVAHGGSLIFYASLCKLLGRGRVISIDVDIRPHNRAAIEAHELAGYVTLVEGDSTDPGVVAAVRARVEPGERGFVVLDSKHTRDHVEAELEAYCGLVGVESYLVVADGIMKDLVGAPRSRPDWAWNNPYAAAQAFLERHAEFALEPPARPFNESAGLRETPTYWPGGWLKRRR